MRTAKDVKSGKLRSSRRFSGSAELKLWNHLRARSLDGRQFIRHHPIGPYIVDFVCRERRLIIEIDGNRKNERDQARERRLAERGYNVLHFPNHEILGNVDGVLEAIRFALAEMIPVANRARGKR